MKKNILSAIIGGALFLASQGMSADFVPHNEPIVSRNPPKPNVMMILDDSTSMKYGEKEIAGKYLDKTYAPLSAVDSGEARNKVLREVVIGFPNTTGIGGYKGGLIDDYINKTYMGFGMLGNGEKEPPYPNDLPDKSILFKIYPEIPESVDMMRARPVTPTTHPLETSGPEVGINLSIPNNSANKMRGKSPNYTIIQSVMTEPDINDPAYRKDGSKDPDMDKYNADMLEYQSNITRFKSRVNKYTGGITKGAYRDSYFGLMSGTANCEQLYAIPGRKVCYELEDISGYVRGGTSLGSAVYSATRYFRNKPLFLGITNDGTTDVMYKKTFKLQYRCQNNFIILLTDGYPTVNSMPAGAAYWNPGENLILAEDKGIVIGDGLQMSLSRAAKIASQIDLRTYQTSATDKAGKPWMDVGSKPLPIVLHAIRFANEVVADAVLKEAVDYSGGKAVGADDRTALELAFHEIFQAIMSTRSGTGAVEDQFKTGTNTIRYASFYNSTAWTGEIQAQLYDAGAKSFKTKKEDLHWTTDTRIAPYQGEFLTLSKGKSVDLSASSLGLNKDSTPKSEKDKNEDYIKWIKGDRQVKNLRVRTTLLGAIIDSDLVYVAKDRLNINLLKLGIATRNEFMGYVLNKVNKMNYNLLISGSNDGLINFIIADKKSGRDLAGTRYASYFPSFFKNDLEKITEKRYEHSFKVNGTTSIFDAKIGKTFQTIGITSMAAGKKALAGYRIFKQEEGANGNYSFDNSIEPLFEIDNTDDFANLGYTYSGAEFFNRYNTEKFGGNEIGAEAIAVFGNGFGVKGSYIYIINAETGKHLNTIELSASGMGAATPALQVESDDNGFHRLNAIYVGDYSGKLYKVTMLDPLDYNNKSIIALYTPDGNDTPITVRPMLVKDKKGAMRIYFGTGMAADINKDLGEDSKKAEHNFFAIKDTNVSRTKNDLDLQTIDNDPIPDNNGYYHIKTSSNSGSNSLNGWYLPLSRLGAGVRVIRPAAATNDNIQFTTWGVDDKESDDLCIGNKLIGPVLYLNLFTGHSSGLGGNSGHSGLGKDGDALGIGTGTGVDIVGSEGGSSSGGIGVDKGGDKKTEDDIKEILKDQGSAGGGDDDGSGSGSGIDDDDCIDGFRLRTHTTGEGQTVITKEACPAGEKKKGKGNREYFKRRI